MAYPTLSSYFEAMAPLSPLLSDHCCWRDCVSRAGPFNWNGLPVELKERVLYFAIPPSNASLAYQSNRWHCGSRRSRRRVLHELYAHLMGNISPLHTCRQMRAIYLRLCFSGSGHDPGLCLYNLRLSDLRASMCEMNKYYQLTDHNSLPVHVKALAVAKTYEYFPKIYPHLRRHATLWHGLRRLWLMMDILDYLQFFKVDVAGFHKFLGPETVTYEIIDQLPMLREFSIMLPNPRGRLGRRRNLWFPPLEPPDRESCPRTLHRLVYERAAKVMASYDGVFMYGFMDEEEMARYESLREHHVRLIRLRSRDMHDIYMEDDSGGIQLDQLSLADYEKLHVDVAEELVWKGPLLNEEEQKFWPPVCKCEPSCDRYIYDVPSRGLTEGKVGLVGIY